MKVMCRFSEDVNWCSHLEMAANKIKYVKSPLVLYRSQCNCHIGT